MGPSSRHYTALGKRAADAGKLNDESIVIPQKKQKTHGAFNRKIAPESREVSSWHNSANVGHQYRRDGHQRTIDLRSISTQMKDGWRYIKTNNFVRAVDTFDQLLSLNLDPCERQRAQLGKARGLQGQKKLKEAEQTFRSLRRHENEKNGKRAADAFSGDLRLELGLACCLGKIGDGQKLKEAEQILRALRRQENEKRRQRDADTFSGHNLIELGLARCLQATGEAEKVREAEQIFRALRRQENRNRGVRDTGAFSGHFQIELGLAYCLKETGDAEKLKEIETIFRGLRRQENQKKGWLPVYSWRIK
ncbi:hypothetical protein [Endozoicomonas sp. YOMI1]|uniref:hypothetical protein n=1 Tax=Endozoicomonas sp. YOMI1 TaxID=2828739 RepID=UPI002148FB78|nr:hypothetical protein [Endozoicomonas sp. YOMI1]